MQTVRDLGHQILQAAGLPVPLKDTCTDALAAPGRLFSPKPVWSQLFLAWIDALAVPTSELFLPAAVACECMAAGYDLLDDVQECLDVSSLARTGRRDLQAGVTLVLLAHELLARLDLPAERRARATAALSRAGRRAWVGQVQDDALRQVVDPSLNVALDVLRRRSGALVAVPSQCAALLAGASWRTVALASRFGHALGCAAQLEDDLADRLEDERHGRHTIPVLLMRLHPTMPDLVEATTLVLIQHYLYEAARALMRLPAATMRSEVLWALLPSNIRTA